MSRREMEVVGFANGREPSSVVCDLRMEGVRALFNDAKGGLIEASRRISGQESREATRAAPSAQQFDGIPGSIGQGRILSFFPFFCSFGYNMEVNTAFRKQGTIQETSLDIRRQVLVTNV
ncbi:hypothetical protein KFK09_016152 [Dendrobium nobile]|uniref:Uncharacterized protein n=1 Tax=Dendrobium nobile TaxID=94219 RepID=A0A8T3AXZ6_DENNO|nr:hypothetical protein KFK09_016152 [Dendrobium nobile]